MTTNKTQQIAALNDAFRILPVGGKVMMTRGIAALGDTPQTVIVQKVRAFADFTPDNDPHGEHDFGAIDYDGHRIFWKIDTFADSTLTYGAEDYTAPECVRVLTIMLADEW